MGGQRGPGSLGRGAAALSAGALAQLDIAQKLMRELPTMKPPRVHSMTPSRATRLVNESVGHRPSAPAPTQDLPSVDDLVLTAQSFEEPAITLDEAFDWLDDYRRQKASTHQSPEKPQEPSKPAPQTPKKPAPTPEPPKPPTPEPGRGFRR